MENAYYQSSKASELPDFKRAACKGMDPDMFIGGSRGSPLDGARIRMARQVCWSCLERKPCLDYALTNPTLIGIWGGTTEEERRAMRHDEDRMGL